MRKQFLFLAIISAILFSACKKSNDVLDTATVSEYSPLVVGKYISYNLDSTVFINFGAKDTVISYQVKHEVSELVKDNLDRPASLA